MQISNFLRSCTQLLLEAKKTKQAQIKLLTYFPLVCKELKINSTNPPKYSAVRFVYRIQPLFLYLLSPPSNPDTHFCFPDLSFSFSAENSGGRSIPSVCSLIGWWDHLYMHSLISWWDSTLHMCLLAGLWHSGVTCIQIKEMCITNHLLTYFLGHDGGGVNGWWRDGSQKQVKKWKSPSMLNLPTLTPTACPRFPVALTAACAPRSQHWYWYFLMSYL